jgi:hypothetical protein
MGIAPARGPAGDGRNGHRGVDQLIDDASIPRRWASVEADSSPASATQWESSNAAAKVGFPTFSRFLVALLTGIFRGMTTIETLVPDTL